MSADASLSPAEWADGAAWAVRRLNHATVDRGVDGAGGYVAPGDVDEVLASVQLVVARLPQALGQAVGWLEGQARAGRVRHDGAGGELGAEVSARAGLGAVLLLAEHLKAARAGLGVVSTALDRAREQSARLSAVPESELEPSPGWAWSPDGDGGGVRGSRRHGATKTTADPEGRPPVGAETPTGGLDPTQL